LVMALLMRSKESISSMEYGCPVFLSLMNYHLQLIFAIIINLVRGFVKLDLAFIMVKFPRK